MFCGNTTAATGAIAADLQHEFAIGAAAPRLESLTALETQGRALALVEVRVEHCIGDLIANLVGVSLGDGLTGE